MTYWIHSTNDDGKRCRVFLRHGSEPGGYFMAEYTGYIDHKRNEIRLYRHRFSVNGCPKEDRVSLFDVRHEPPPPPKADPPEAAPVKTVRKRLPDPAGQMTIEI